MLTSYKIMPKQKNWKTTCAITTSTFFWIRQTMYKTPLLAMYGQMCSFHNTPSLS
jgi:hypothetical protein